MVSIFEEEKNNRFNWGLLATGSYTIKRLSDRNDGIIFEQNKNLTQS